MKQEATISNLQNKWNKEKEYYRNQELGSGIHSFVKDCLENKEFFSLREGSLSTSLEDRKNEFIHENKTKESRRSDFVLYINQDIVIPVEAECFGSISKGIDQIFNYQKDLDKKYGILTDGYTWRFYNNNLYKQYTIDWIFSHTELFLEFWNEYIKPELYYLTFFEPRGQQSFLRDLDLLPIEKFRQIFFDDITNLIRSFNNKLKIEGYFPGESLGENSRMAVEITYAYVIQFILYKTLVDNEFGDFKDEFDTIVKSIHGCLQVNQFGKILDIIEGISNKISQNIYRPFREEQEFIDKFLRELRWKPKNELHEVSPWLDIFIFIKKYDFSNIQNDIFGYIYENYLKEISEEEKRGQYYTDPAVVNFMLDQIGYTKENLKSRYKHDNKSISLIDPACGSGTFLYRAVDAIIKTFWEDTFIQSRTTEEIINNNIFGFDVAEFPLYLAEMSILMRMLPMIITEKYNNPVDKKIKVFKTRDSIAEFMNANIVSGQLDLMHKFLALDYESYVRQEDDLEELKDSLNTTPESQRFRFDYVIGNPPYIGYNSSAAQKILIFELMKQNKVKLSNIYGVNLHSTPNKSKKYPPKPNLYAFFIALGIALLKDNGKLCYIIPQTILTEPDYDVLRYHLSKFTTIEKLITFNRKMFIGRGLRQDKLVETSSLIFVINRQLPSESHKVEVINYKNRDENIDLSLQNILAGKNITKNMVDQSYFLENTDNWNFIKQEESFLNLYNEYKSISDPLAYYYDHASAKYYFDSQFYFDVGFILDNKEILKSPQENCLELIDFSSFTGYSKYQPNSYYPNDHSKIQLPKNCQGYVTLEQEYKIVWSKVYSYKFYFTDRPVIPSMSYSQLIASNNKRELLFLLSLLNSKLNKTIYEERYNLDNEQYGSFLAISRIKETIRIPKMRDLNQTIKNEIIRKTEELLALEEYTLSDFVDFSKIFLQKCDNVYLENDELILENEGRNYHLPIKQKNEIVKNVIRNIFSDERLPLDKNKIYLSSLKSYPVIDYSEQEEIKNCIDDLIYVLYFKLDISDEDLIDHRKIKKVCRKHHFYSVIENQTLK